MFKVFVGQKELEYKKFVFNGGEVSIKLSLEENNAYSIVNSSSPCFIVANLESSDSIFELMHIVDAIRRSVGYKTSCSQLCQKGG